MGFWGTIKRFFTEGRQQQPKGQLKSEEGRMIDFSIVIDGIDGFVRISGNMNSSGNPALSAVQNSVSVTVMGEDVDRAGVGRWEVHISASKGQRVRVEGKTAVKALLAAFQQGVVFNDKEWEIIQGALNRAQHLISLLGD